MNHDGGGCFFLTIVLCVAAVVLDYAYGVFFGDGRDDE